MVFGKLVVSVCFGVIHAGGLLLNIQAQADWQASTRRYTASRSRSMFQLFFQRNPECSRTP